MTVENLTPLEEAIRVLEAFKRGGLHDTGARTNLDGYNIALRIIRTLSTTHNVTDQGDRLVRAFEEYAHTQKHMKTIRIDKCSECGGNHGYTVMVKWKGEGTVRYFAICPVILQAMYHFPDDGGS